MLVHLTPIPKDGDSYEVRVFMDTLEEPLGPIDPATGQPWKQWAAGCNVHVKDGVATVTLIKEVPPGSFFALRRTLRDQLGVTRVEGERWPEPGVKRDVSHSLGKRRTIWVKVSDVIRRFVKAVFRH